MTDVPTVLTVEQVADLVQLSTKTVMRAIGRNELRASQLTYKRGGWRIQADDVTAWLEERANRRPDHRPVDPAPPASPPALSQRRCRVPSRSAPTTETLRLTPDMGRSHDTAA